MIEAFQQQILLYVTSPTYMLIVGFVLGTAFGALMKTTTVKGK